MKKIIGVFAVFIIVAFCFSLNTYAADQGNTGTQKVKVEANIINPVTVESFNVVTTTTQANQNWTLTRTATVQTGTKNTFCIVTIENFAEKSTYDIAAGDVIQKLNNNFSCALGN